MEHIAISSHQLAFAYGKSALPIFEGVDIELKPGSFLAILGRNGSGKSTLLSCLNGLLKPTAGVVRIGAQDLNSVDRQTRAQTMAYVTQHSHANSLTVYDALLLGRKPYLIGAPHEEDYEVVDQVIEEFKLEPLALRNIHELSGGEYQKMIIARAFVQQPQVLLLDEPTNNLDLANQIEVLRIVRDAVDRRGIAAVTVLHDINLALAWCDAFAFLDKGAVRAYGDSSIVTAELVSEVYDVEAKIIDIDGRKVVMV